MTNKYFQWIQQETGICKTFQKYIESKRPNTKTYLSTRSNKQAPIDFLWRIYDKDTWNTITELAVEVRSLNISKSDIVKGRWYIEFPIAKLNELMTFWRMGKEVYIVYLLKDKVFFLKWSYYLKHNFEIWKYKWNIFIKLYIRNLINCEDLKK